MATKQVITCDICEAAAKPGRFGLRNDDYSIDLCAKHAKEIDKALQPFIAVARKVTGKRRTGRRNSGSVQSSDIRTWAKANGYEVSARGRIAADIVKAYEDAQAG